MVNIKELETQTLLAGNQNTVIVSKYIYLYIYMFLCMCGLDELLTRYREYLTSLAPLEIYLLGKLVTYSIVILPTVYTERESVAFCQYKQGLICHI